MVYVAWERFVPCTLAHSSGQLAKPRQFEAFALPGFDREHDPEKDHSERCQDSKNKKTIAAATFESKAQRSSGQKNVPQTSTLCQA